MSILFVFYDLLGSLPGKSYLKYRSTQASMTLTVITVVCNSCWQNNCVAAVGNNTYDLGTSLRAWLIYSGHMSNGLLWTWKPSDDRILGIIPYSGLDLWMLAQEMYVMYMYEHFTQATESSSHRPSFYASPVITS
ncbi:hypothetical protein FKM82_015771 [Ascaphus truei]